MSHGGTAQRRMAQFLILGVVAAALAACQSTPAPPTLPGEAPADFPFDRYRSDPTDVRRVTDGLATIYVYRGGRLKHLGHNHVISARGLQGLLRIPDDGEPASTTGAEAHLYLPLATLVVDDPAARAAAGADFSSTPSERDRAGTRNNLLGPKVLNAEQYPYLQATVTLLRADLAEVILSVAGHETTHQIPVQIEQREGDALAVTADFELTHAAIGLTPFSVLGGAIAVADPIRVRLEFAARPAKSIQGAFSQQR